MVANTQHHFLVARNRIEDCYGSLLVDLMIVEVGTLGHFMPVTVTKLSNVCHLLKSTICCILQQVACVAISCLYRIFNAQALVSWDVVDLLN